MMQRKDICEGSNWGRMSTTVRHQEPEFIDMSVGQGEDATEEDQFDLL
jgi:hypothetical protein